MRDGPAGVQLLAIARACLLEEVLPNVPPAQIYAVRMIANAMAIAARELAADPGEEAVRERIISLYRQAGLMVPDASQRLGEIERMFAADIRAGWFDSHEAALTAFLEWQVDQRLALANPKLRRPGRDPGDDRGDDRG
ncbi:MAG TPA: DUF6285 domain-containing protein [Acetobacteraceae bacterium]|nr:DUF6285 domain-containing protein [Acetobacteraceae bacterium]